MIHSLEGYQVINHGQPMTNIFRFQMTRDIGMDYLTLCAQLKTVAIYINASFENDCVRLVTHKDVRLDDIEYLVE